MRYNDLVKKAVKHLNNNCCTTKHSSKDDFCYTQVFLKIWITQNYRDQRNQYSFLICNEYSFLRDIKFTIIDQLKDTNADKEVFRD